MPDKLTVSQWLSVALASALNSSNPAISEALIKQLPEDSPARFDSFLTLCTTCHRLGDAVGIEQAAKGAITLAKEDKARAAEGKGFLTIASWMQGQYGEAMKLLAFTKSIAQETNDRSLEARAIGHTGIVHRVRGQHESALNCYNEALSIARELKNRTMEGSNLGNIGTICHEQGKYD